MEKTALVLGGGGSRGAYEVGVWKALRELGENFDIVTGTSVGALNGAVAVQGDLDKAVELWSTISTELVLNIEQALPDDSTIARERETFGKLSATEKLARLGLFAREIVVNRGADSTPLRRLLSAHIDEHRVRASACELGIVTVRLDDGKPCTLFREDIPEGMLVDYLLASAACFPAMKKQTIADKSYIDGGYYDNLPIELALSGGARRIIAVDIQGIGIYRKPVLPAGVCIEYVTTAWNLGPILLFEKETALRNMQLGYFDMMKKRGRYEGLMYTFELGECESLRQAAVRTGLRWGTYFGSETPVLLPALRLRVLRTLEGRYRSLFTRAIDTRRKPHIDAALAAVENAALVFELDPTVSYTSNGFLDALRRQIDRTDAPDTQALEGLVRRSVSLQEKGEKLRRETEKLSVRSVGRLMLQEIEKPTLTAKQLAALAFAFPAEAAAAAIAAMLRGEAGTI